MMIKIAPGIYTHRTGGGEWRVSGRTATHTETLQEGVLAEAAGMVWFVALETFEAQFTPRRVEPVLPDAPVDVGDEDVQRLLKHAHRIEREGKTEIAAVIYTAASEIARLRDERDPERFIEFVLRHTLPERAKAHGADTMHSIIKYHPFVTSRAKP